MKNSEQIFNKIAIKYGLTPVGVRNIVESAFHFVPDTIRGGDRMTGLFGHAHIPYFGAFFVPQKNKKAMVVKNIKWLQYTKPDAVVGMRVEVFNMVMNMNIANYKYIGLGTISEVGKLMDGRKIVKLRAAKKIRLDSGMEISGIYTDWFPYEDKTEKDDGFIDIEGL